jgi:guanylate kinase
MVIGPSGVGKNTVIAAAREKRPFASTVSCTTRLPREHEVNGINYHFTSREEFNKKINNDEFAEYAEVHGNLYGTLTSDLDNLLNSGQDVVFDIDIQGAKQIKDKFTQALTIFIAPPSIDDLKKRILADTKRKHTEEDLKIRLQTAEREMKEIGLADHVIYNNQLEDAVSEFLKVLD